MTEELEHNNVISFCITDDNAETHQVAIENAKLVSKLLPEWEGHFYVYSDLSSEIKDALSSQENCSVYMIEEKAQTNKDIWSFMPLGQPNSISTLVSRDCNVLLTEDDVIAIKAWLDSPYQFSVKATEEGLNIKSFCAKLHGPVNTIWLIHYLHTLNPEGEMETNELFDRFYGAFNFLFFRESE